MRTLSNHMAGQYCNHFLFDYLHWSYLKGCNNAQGPFCGPTGGSTWNTPVAQVSPMGTEVTKQPHSLTDGFHVKKCLSGSEGAVKKVFCDFPWPGQRHALAKNSRMKSFPSLSLSVSQSLYHWRSLGQVLLDLYWVSLLVFVSRPGCQWAVLKLIPSQLCSHSFSGHLITLLLHNSNVLILHTYTNQRQHFVEITLCSSV